MKDTIVTAEILEPYAQALMSVARSHDLVDRFGDDVNFILSLLKESEDLRQLLANPLVKPEVKKGVLRQLGSEQLHLYILNFLMLLIDRKRILFLEGICKQYQILLRQLRKTVLAEVTSAIELTDAQKDTVRQKVISMVNAEHVELETHIDLNLIGGVIIKVGSQIIDASLRGQLRRIGLRLTSTT
jgi:F-type H+-transporting ATPase subunit delta